MLRSMWLLLVVSLTIICPLAHEAFGANGSIPQLTFHSIVSHWCSLGLAASSVGARRRMYEKGGGTSQTLLADPPRKHKGDARLHCVWCCN